MTVWKHALVAAGIMTLVVTPVLCAQGQPPAASAPPAQSALAGPWRLNRDLSAKPVEMLGLAKDTGGKSGDNATRPQAGGGLSLSDDEKRVMREVLKEATEPPEQIVISVKENAVTFIDSTGLVRTFDTTYQKEKHPSSAGQVETRTRWEGQSLTIDATVAGIMVKKVYSPAPQGRRVVLQVTVESPRLPQRVPVMLFVYDPV